MATLSYRTRGDRYDRDALALACYYLATVDSAQMDAALLQKAASIWGGLKRLKTFLGGQK